MKKVYLIFGTIALALIALLALGCGQVTGEGGGPAAGVPEAIQEVHIVQYRSPKTGFGRTVYNGDDPGATILVALSQEHTGTAPVDETNFKVTIAPGAKAPQYTSQELTGVPYTTPGTTAPGANQFVVIDNRGGGPVNTGKIASKSGTGYYPAVYTLALHAEIEDGQVITVKYDPKAGPKDWANDPVSAASAVLDLADSDKSHILGTYDSSATGGYYLTSPNYIDFSGLTASALSLQRKGETDANDTLTPSVTGSAFPGGLTFAQVYGARYDGTAKDFVLYRVQTAPEPLVEWINVGVTPDAAGVLSFGAPPAGTEGYYVYNGATVIGTYGRDAQYDRLKPTIAIKSVTRDSTATLTLELVTSEAGRVFYSQAKTVSTDGSASEYGDVALSASGARCPGFQISTSLLDNADVVPALPANTLTGKIAVTLRDRAGNWAEPAWDEIGKLIPAPNLTGIVPLTGGSQNANKDGHINWTSIQNGVQVAFDLNGDGVTTNNIGTAGDDMDLVLQFTDRYGKVVEVKKRVNVPGAQSGTTQNVVIGVENNAPVPSELIPLRSLAETADAIVPLNIAADEAIKLVAWLQSAEGKLKSTKSAEVNVYKDTIRPRKTAVCQIGAASDGIAVVWSEPIAASGTPGTFNYYPATQFTAAAVPTTQWQSRTLHNIAGSLDANAAIGYTVPDAAAGLQDYFNNPAEGFAPAAIAPPATLKDIMSAYNLEAVTDITASAAPGTTTITAVQNNKFQNTVFTVPKGFVLDADSVSITFASLTVMEGGVYRESSGNLTVSSSLVNNGTIESTGAGTFTFTGAAVVNGSKGAIDTGASGAGIVMTSGAFTNHGAITLGGAAGTIAISGTALFTNHGAISGWAAADSAITLGAGGGIDGAITLGDISGGVTIAGRWTGGAQTILFKDNGELDGASPTATLTADSAAANGVITATAGKTLTLTKNITLELGAAKGKIVLKGGPSDGGILASGAISATVTTANAAGPQSLNPATNITFGGKAITLNAGGGSFDGDDIKLTNAATSAALSQIGGTHAGNIKAGPDDVTIDSVVIVASF